MLFGVSDPRAYKRNDDSGRRVIHCKLINETKLSLYYYSISAHCEWFGGLGGASQGFNSVLACCAGELVEGIGCGGEIQERCY
jgi:hypothetical protein